MKYCHNHLRACEIVWKQKMLFFGETMNESADQVSKSSEVTNESAETMVDQAAVDEVGDDLQPDKAPTLGSGAPDAIYSPTTLEAGEDQIDLYQAHAQYLLNTIALIGDDHRTGTDDPQGQLAIYKDCGGGAALESSLRDAITTLSDYR